MRVEKVFYVVFVCVLIASCIVRAENVWYQVPEEDSILYSIKYGQPDRYIACSEAAMGTENLWNHEMRESRERCVDARASVGGMARKTRAPYGPRHAGPPGEWRVCMCAPCRCFLRTPPNGPAEMAASGKRIG